MTNGGGRAAPDDFGRAAARLAAAQLCQAAGFHGATASALDAFADVAIRYLLDLGRTAESYANLAGRSQCSVFDAIRAFEDLEAPRAFSGAGAGVREIANFVESADEVPFAQPIPQFPVIREGTNTKTNMNMNMNIPSFDQMGETPPSKHIPAWLPALPDPHTYIHTPVWDERVSDPREDKIEQARQRRKAERSLLSLQKRLLLRNGSVEAKATTSASSDSAAGLDPQVVGGDDKDVSPVVKVSDEGGGGGGGGGDGKRVSVLEAFGPAIEMLGGGGLCDEDEDGMGGRERTELPAARPTVHFQTGKKFIGESLDTKLRKKDVSRTAALAGREDERDDKKRRAEYILKQSMENPQELTLL
uniref:Transcription initiation factor TFIID subunit 8 n=1 Tax=Cajanus cajan TaxID=3821 RepID=A0A151S2X5_CAJCA|nr:Transcription initiation factor TFIID subunit 8 [Cajanus cajan]